MAALPETAGQLAIGTGGEGDQAGAVLRQDVEGDVRVILPTTFVGPGEQTTNILVATEVLREQHDVPVVRRIVLAGGSPTAAPLDGCRCGAGFGACLDGE